MLERPDTDPNWNYEQTQEIFMCSSTKRSFLLLLKDGLDGLGSFRDCNFQTKDPRINYNIMGKVFLKKEPMSEKEYIPCKTSF